MSRHSLVLCVMLVGCEGAIDGPRPSEDELAVEVPFDEQGALARIQAYRVSDEFVQVNARLFKSAVSDSLIREWVSRPAEPVFRQLSPEARSVAVRLPEGALIVREVINATTGQVSKLTVIGQGRAGFNPEVSDFWFAVTSPTGVPLEKDGVRQVGKLTACFGCHQGRANQSFLFGVSPSVDEATEVQPMEGHQPEQPEPQPEPIETAPGMPVQTDVCGFDTDGDGVGDACDSCRFISNASQADWNRDGRGDACGVLISEVAAAGPGGSRDEFIELFNPAPAAVDVSGWRVQYRAQAGTGFSTRVTMPVGSVVPARGFLLVVGAGYVGPTADVVRQGLLGELSLSLAETGGALRLGSANVGSEAEAAEALDGMSWPAGLAFSGGASLERKAAPHSNAQSMSAGDAARGNAFDTDDDAFDFVVRVQREPQSTRSAAEP